MKKLMFTLCLVLLSTASVFAQGINWAPPLHEAVTATVEASEELGAAEAAIYAELLAMEVLDDPPTEAQMQTLGTTLVSLEEESSFALFSFYVESVTGLGGYFDSIGIGLFRKVCTCYTGNPTCNAGHTCSSNKPCRSASGSLNNGTCR